MNPLLLKGLAGLLLFSAVTAGLAGLHHHVFGQGVAQEKARRDKIDAANTIAAQTELAGLNAKLRSAQSDLTKAIESLSVNQMELSNEKSISAARQSALLSGAARERVLVRARSERVVGETGSVGSAAVAAVGQGASDEEDLDPGVAAGLERLRANENSAVDRLNACVSAYDAVRAASQ